MKKQIAAPALLFFALSGFIYLMPALQGRPGLLFFGETKSADQILTVFRLEHKPIVEINFSALYGDNGQYQVLQPILKIQRPRSNQICAEGETDTGQAAGGSSLMCTLTNSWPASKIDKEPFFTNEDEKREALAQFLVTGMGIPESFILMPPFVDSHGFSYAFLLTSKNIAPFSEKSWVMRHLSLYRTSELFVVMQKYKIDNPAYAVIAETSEAEMAELVKGEPIVLTRNHLFIKNEAQFGFSPLDYSVYDRQLLQGRLKTSSYTLLPFVAGDICLQKIGNACWTYSSRQAVSYLYKYALLVMALLAIIIAGSIAFYIKSQIQKAREHRRQRLSLQVLSHELRTPVSSMLLLSEQIAKSLFKFDSDDQDLVIRLSSEIFKMQRFVEVSGNYLQSSGGRIQVRHGEIASINNWITDLAQEYGRKIRCDLLAADRAVYTDSFWLRLVLSNFLQNAINHGAEPIVLRLQGIADSIKITVEDGGRCEFSLRQMTEPFIKSTKSKGMGLGLNIVNHVATECGYDLQFTKNPTAFSISFQQERKREATV